MARSHTADDTLVEPGQREGRYRDGHGGYGRVLQAIGEGRHHSCLLVTSRESPPEFDTVGGGAIRTLDLGGLGLAEGQALLADKQLKQADWVSALGSSVRHNYSVRSTIC